MKFEARYHECVLRSGRGRDIRLSLSIIITGEDIRLNKFPRFAKDRNNTSQTCHAEYQYISRDVAATNVQPNCIVGLMRRV